MLNTKIFNAPLNLSLVMNRKYLFVNGIADPLFADKIDEEFQQIVDKENLINDLINNHKHNLSKAKFSEGSFSINQFTGLNYYPAVVYSRASNSALVALGYVFSGIENDFYVYRRC